MQEKTLQNPKIRTSNIHSMDFGSVSYDIFGLPYQKSGSFLADDSLDFGYLGKPYNSDTELYDYGFRDYSPKIARFSTVDPIRDGRNWYSYVVNDPVNYVDLWGLQCQSESDGEKHSISFTIYRDNNSKLSSTNKEYRGLDRIEFRNNQTGETFNLYGTQTYVSNSNYSDKNTLKPFSGGFTIQYLGNKKTSEDTLYGGFDTKYKGPVFNVQNAYTVGLNKTNEYGSIIGDSDSTPIRIHSNYNLVTNKEVSMASGGCPIYQYEQIDGFVEFLEKNNVKQGDVIFGYIKEYYEP